MIHLWKTFHFDTALLSAPNEGPDTDLYMVGVTTHKRGIKAKKNRREHISWTKCPKSSYPCKGLILIWCLNFYNKRPMKFTIDGKTPTEDIIPKKNNAKGVHNDGVLTKREHLILT